MKKKVSAHLALLFSATIWGLMAPVGKAAMESGISALSLASMRMVGGAVCFWCASLLVPYEKVSVRDLFALFFASLFGIVLNQGAYTFGLSMTSPVDASIIVTVMPIITMILAAVFLKEPISLLKASGVALGLGGALLLVLGAGGISDSGNSGNGNIWGNLLCLGASFSFACYLTIFKKLISRYHIFTLMKWMFLYAAICFLPVASSDLKETFAVHHAFDVWLEVGYVVIFGTFVAYIFMLHGQQNLRPTVVSMYNYVQPVVSATASIIAGIALFDWSKVLAAALIFVGVYCVTKSRARGELK